MCLFVSAAADLFAPQRLAPLLLLLLRQLLLRQRRLVAGGPLSVLREREREREREGERGRRRVKGGGGAWPGGERPLALSFSTCWHGGTREGGGEEGRGGEERARRSGRENE